MKSFFAAALLIASLDVHATDANSCEDFNMRHYRKDLVVESVAFQEKYLNDAYQEIQIKVKNVGEVNMSGTGLRWLKVRVKGVLRSIQIQLPINSGATRTVKVAFPSGHLTRCQRPLVVIDEDHTIGQWGCKTWDNDYKFLTANMIGTAECSIITPPPGGFDYPIEHMND